MRAAMGTRCARFRGTGAGRGAGRGRAVVGLAFEVRGDPGDPLDAAGDVLQRKRGVAKQQQVFARQALLGEDGGGLVERIEGFGEQWNQKPT